MEAIVQGDPCDTIATSPNATGTQQPGSVEHMKVEDLILGSGISEAGGPLPVASGGPRGSLQLRTARLAGMNPPVRVTVPGSRKTPTVREDWQSRFSAYLG